MEIKIIQTELASIQAFRILFLQENNFQFIHNKCHEYGWADTYLFTSDGIKIGYGSVWGRNKREERDAIFEFYIIKPYRKFANEIFPGFCAASNATFIECQGNDLLLSSMLYEYAQNINAEAILFEDNSRTHFDIPSVIFQKKAAEDHVRDDDRQYILKQDGEVIASGGLMLNYNVPYADIYYEVNENYRKKGLGSLMIQELKKEAYLSGRVPAARCNIKNLASKATMLKAGFVVCGHLLYGKL